MCITLLVKLVEELGQNRHCPGVNGCIAGRGESIDSMADAVGVVTVVGNRMSMYWEWAG